VRSECLDWILIWNQHQLRQVLGLDRRSPPLRTTSVMRRPTNQLNRSPATTIPNHDQKREPAATLTQTTNRELKPFRPGK